jgi:hypothetical protein
MIGLIKRIIASFMPGEWPVRPHILVEERKRVESALTRFRAARWASIRALEQHIVTPMPRIRDFEDPDYLWPGYQVIYESGIWIAPAPNEQSGNVPD